MVDAEFEARLKQITQSYAASLPETLAAIMDSWRNLESNWQEAHATTLMKLCHQLAGSASTFGFSEISSLSRAVEETLRGHVENATLPTTADVQKLSETLRALQGQVDNNL